MQYRDARKSSFERMGDRGIKIYQNHAHVVTGRMRSNIKKTKVTPDLLEITALMGYSGYENARGNPHDFFTRGTNEFVEELKKEFDLVTSNTINKRGF